MIQAIIFDFDGVILGSSGIKTQTFAALFEHEADHVDAIVALHKRHEGISRFRKFDLIYSDILQRPLPASEREGLGERFTELALAAILSCPMIAGAEDFLKVYSGAMPLFIASGTPHGELADILAHRQLSGFFREAHGSPRLKTEIGQDIMQRHGLAPRNVLFVGDATTDYEAAKALGTPFLGVVAPGMNSPFPAGTATAPDLRDLPGHIREFTESMS